MTGLNDKKKDVSIESSSWAQDKLRWQQHREIKSHESPTKSSNSTSEIQLSQCRQLVQRHHKHLCPFIKIQLAERLRHNPCIFTICVCKEDKNKLLVASNEKLLLELVRVLFIPIHPSDHPGAESAATAVVDGRQAPAHRHVPPENTVEQLSAARVVCSFLEASLFSGLGQLSAGAKFRHEHQSRREMELANE